MTTTGLYYEHSGNYSFGGALTGLAAGLVAGFILAVVYAYLEIYIPIAGYITFIMAAGFGLLTGAATGWGLMKGNVRHNGVGTLVGLVVGLIALHISWAVWIYAMIRRAEFDASLIIILLRPDLMWEAILGINADGAWSMRSWTPTGIVLWTLWGIEALIVVGATVATAAGSIMLPFCETCKNWCEQEEGAARLALAEGGELKSHLESKNFGFVEKLGAPAPGAVEYLRLDLCCCKSCGTTNTLAVKSVTLDVDKRGETSESTTDILENLLLSSDEVAKVRRLAELAPASSPGVPSEPSTGEA